MINIFILVKVLLTSTTQEKVPKLIKMLQLIVLLGV